MPTVNWSEIVVHRYLGGDTQQQIADDTGLKQSYISRLLIKEALTNSKLAERMKQNRWRYNRYSGVKLRKFNHPGVR